MCTLYTYRVAQGDSPGAPCSSLQCKGLYQCSLQCKGGGNHSGEDGSGTSFPTSHCAHTQPLVVNLIWTTATELTEYIVRLSFFNQSTMSQYILTIQLRYGTDLFALLHILDLFRNKKPFVSGDK